MQELDYVYEVWSAGSFSAAAKKLFVSQPALSAAVKKTETELGIVIFDRSTTPLSLTEEGRVYMDAAEKIRLAREEMRTHLADISHLRRGHLTLGGENLISSMVMPQLIQAYVSRYPGVQVELLEANCTSLRRLLLAESVDLLIAHDFDETLYTFEPLFSETLFLAVPDALPLPSSVKCFALSREDILTRRYTEPSCPRVSLSRFRDEEFLLLKKGTDMNKRAGLFFAEAGIDPAVKLYLDQLLTAYNMACEGMGVTFVSDLVVRNIPRDGCHFYLPDSAHIRRSMSVGYKKNRYLSRAATAFIDVARTFPVEL